MLLSAVYVSVVAQSSSEIPEGLMNNPVYNTLKNTVFMSFETHIVYISCKIGGLMGEEGLMEEDWNDRSNWRKKII